MSTSAMIWIMISIAAYLLLMIFIGAMFMKKNNNSEDYFLGGRSLNGFVAALSAGAWKMVNQHSSQGKAVSKSLRMFCWKRPASSRIPFRRNTSGGHGNTGSDGRSATISGLPPEVSMRSLRCSHTRPCRICITHSTRQTSQSSLIS